MTTTDVTLFDLPPSQPRPAPPPPAEAAPLPIAEHGSLRFTVEAELKRRGIPYVDVAEARKALFASNRLKTFHFCVYAPEGDNWLLLCRRPSDADRRDLAEWQQIFGDGFKAVFAMPRKAGIVFQTLDGERLSLDELAP